MRFAAIRACILPLLSVGLGQKLRFANHLIAARLSKQPPHPPATLAWLGTMVDFKKCIWAILADLCADVRQRPPNRTSVLPYRLNKLGIFLEKPRTGTELVLTALRPKPHMTVLSLLSSENPGIFRAF